jgi:MerR family transcriptional regulator, copper efflux regulator
MLINELAKATSVSAHTIRYYEKFGLIKGKQKLEVKSNNYFHYDEETVYKLELIREAKAIGFTLSEIKKLIDAWYNNKFSLTQKLAVLDEKLLSIDEKISQLKKMKKLLLVFKKEVIKDDC